MAPTNCRQKSRLTSRHSWILLVCALAILAFVEGVKRYLPDPLNLQKQIAGRFMQQATKKIKNEKTRLGLAIDPDIDPNLTGLIGVEYNDLTTTLGSLASKRTSVNPEFAAVVVDMLNQAGVHAGDPVAVSFSGSFPALNIAVLSAAAAFRLQPAIISSVGASTFGANEPQLTWLDMEKLLYDEGVFPYRSAAVSLGGIAEEKGGLDGTGIELGLQAVRRSGLPYLEEVGISTLPADIERRMAIYDQALKSKKPAAYINVGGALPSLGNSLEANSLSPGVLLKVPFSDHPEKGILFRMGGMGIPVIHLLNIKSIARQYSIPIDPVPLPAAIQSRPGKYHAIAALLGLISLIAISFYLTAMLFQHPRWMKPRKTRKARKVECFFVCSVCFVVAVST